MNVKRDYEDLEFEDRNVTMDYGAKIKRNWIICP
jgi:hypothetical protein